jgi:hypothetical protein
VCVCVCVCVRTRNISNVTFDPPLHETPFLTAREAQMLGLLRGIFGRKSEEILGGSRTLRKEEQHNVCCLIIRVQNEGSGNGRDV